MCRLLVIDENGNQVKTENSEVKNYSLSIDEQNKLTLKITRSDNKILSYSGVVSCFSDSTCSVFKVRGNSYVICN